MIRNLTFAAIAALAVVPTARAQESAGKLAVDDRLFAPAAAAGGMAEVTLSQMGEKKATDPELKKFSEKMVAAHTKVNKELKALAAEKGIALPTTLDARATFCGEALNGLSGEEFDRCYAKAQLHAHMDALAAFEAEAERGADPEIRAFAAKVVPHVKEHLKEIKPIAMRYEKEMLEKK